MSDIEYEGYKFKSGDHWVDEPLEAFEHHSNNHRCSSEFHALHGVLLGTKKGNITQGSLVYMELALGARVNGTNSALALEIRHLGAYGLFAKGPLDNEHSRRFFDRSGATIPVVDMTDAQNKPYDWSHGVYEGVSVIEPDYKTPAVIMICAILSSVSSGVLKNGDPAYGKMLLEAAKESGNADRYATSLKQLGEFGFFSEEMLLGCQPERNPSVNRVR